MCRSDWRVTVYVKVADGLNGTTRDHKGPRETTRDHEGPQGTMKDYVWRSCVFWASPWVQGRDQGLLNHHTEQRNSVKTETNPINYPVDKLPQHYWTGRASIRVRSIVCACRCHDTNRNWFTVNSERESCGFYVLKTWINTTVVR